MRIFWLAPIIILSFDLPLKKTHKQILEHLVARAEMLLSLSFFGLAPALPLSPPPTQKKLLSIFGPYQNTFFDNFLAEGAKVSIVSFCSGRG